MLLMLSNKNTNKCWCSFGLRYFIETFIQISRHTQLHTHILPIHAPLIHTKEAREEKKRERRGKIEK
jgi:hypothetical protein